MEKLRAQAPIERLSIPEPDSGWLFLGATRLGHGQVRNYSLIWLLHGRPVIALTETAATILAPSGASLMYRRYIEPVPRLIGEGPTT